jgi:shikimate kinase
MKKNIVLIGMPGVGKSSAGIVLAKVIGYKFVDSDLIIQEKKGMLLKDIIKDKGIDGFINIENDINKSLEAESTVIATGGSAVYGSEAMEHFKKIGTIVYLKASYEEISQRLGDLDGRGVVHRQGQSLRDLYDERTELYEKYADITVEEDGKSIRETVLEIEKRLYKTEKC